MPKICAECQEERTNHGKYIKQNAAISLVDGHMDQTKCSTILKDNLKTEADFPFSSVTNCQHKLPGLQLIGLKLSIITFRLVPVKAYPSKLENLWQDVKNILLFSLTNSLLF